MSMKLTTDRLLPDAHLARSRVGDVHFALLQDLRSPVCSDDDGFGFHVASLMDGFCATGGDEPARERT
jgi:hypothetical protein